MVLSHDLLQISLLTTLLFYNKIYKKKSRSELKAKKIAQLRFILLLIVDLKIIENFFSFHNTYLLVSKEKKTHHK